MRALTLTGMREESSDVPSVYHRISDSRTSCDAPLGTKKKRRAASPSPMPSCVMRVWKRFASKFR